MPELPEVEVVRRGLAAHVEGRTIASVETYGARVLRRHLPGPEDFAARLAGARISAVRRRGKYLWLVVDDHALLIHLGMSGQFRVARPGDPDPKHVHARFRFAGEGAGGEDLELRFADQRTFGGLALWPMLPGDGTPEPIAHIAPDPFEEAYDVRAVARRARRSSSGIKRLLLNQSLVSGIGNIYADEALWRARVHGERPGNRLTGPAIERILGHARDVMATALDQGGTSFDALYVNINGESGFFDRSLNVYGREGEPCLRCGTPIRRAPFMNRSSHFCPRCQRKR